MLPISKVWAGHPVGFELLTVKGRQYVAYYDDQRQMTLATPMKPLLGGATSHWPALFAPHATIEPSALTPTLWWLPAATPTKPVFGRGTSHCPAYV